MQHIQYQQVTKTYVHFYRKNNTCHKATLFSGHKIKNMFK